MDPRRPESDSERKRRRRPNLAQELCRLYTALGAPWSKCPRRPRCPSKLSPDRDRESPQVFRRLGGLDLRDRVGLAVAIVVEER